MPRKKKLGDTQTASQPESGPSSFAPPPASSDQGAGDPPAGPAIGETQVGSAQLGGPRVLRSYKRSLPYTLGDAELRLKAIQLAQTFDEVRLETAAQKEVVDGLKAKMSNLLIKQSQLARVVQSGRDVADVDIDLVICGEIVQEIRRDTGEPISSREATPGEMQGIIPLEASFEDEGDGADPKE